MSLTLKERTKIIDILELYSEYLMEHGYLDTDWYTEEPHTVADFITTDEFINLTKK